MKTVTVTMTYDTRLARAWIRTMSVLRFAVGRVRAERWALWGARRFTKVRIHQDGRLFLKPGTYRISDILGRLGSQREKP